ncbi:hypothetical protein LTR17_023889 [Elasticomyces elasticus]|nr:hypothetical protein LTR17_023889 [Elasticomyces elasticus]
MLRGLHFMTRTGSDPRAQSDEDAVPIVASFDSRTQPGVIHFDDNAQQRPETLYCLSIYRDTEKVGVEQTRDHIIGLVLAPLPGFQQRFHRLGYFHEYELEILKVLLEPTETVIELV